jgi:hypothetical protein
MIDKKCGYNITVGSDFAHRSSVVRGFWKVAVERGFVGGRVDGREAMDVRDGLWFGE